FARVLACQQTKVLSEMSLSAISHICPGSFRKFVHRPGRPGVPCGDTRGHPGINDKKGLPVHKSRAASPVGRRSVLIGEVANRPSNASRPFLPQSPSAFSRAESAEPFASG